MFAGVARPAFDACYIYKDCCVKRLKWVQLRKERKDYAIRCHDGGLCTQKQAGVQLVIITASMCDGQAQVLDEYGQPQAFACKLTLSARGKPAMCLSSPPCLIAIPCWHRQVCCENR